MAEFMPGLQSLLPPPSYPSSFPFLGMDPNSDLLDHTNFPFHLNNPVDNPIPSVPFGNHGPGLVFPHEPLTLQTRNMTGSVLATVRRDDSDHRDKKRKNPLEFSQGSCSASANSPDPAKRRKRGSGGKGRKAEERGEEDKGKKEVVHVRARRGQATDSHSLAERVRRGKINERLRFLQDIVPGCYKTMGLAVMLDEIINYVHSLQHQVEFLSMKLTAASTLSYDVNSGSDLMDAMMQGAEACEAKELDRLVMRSQLEAYSAAASSILQSATFHHNPFDQSM
ncbi:hypothetical protein MLD38_032835 [Melastoma candidum]|uniref:Uncharacterized protein n=1 Tax=Melastoma candidum TaxID=119954 RepID=A0ACB9M579_9MYRT|nr:hypothetical protein MLD38_032835 [Melastoma candidum]